MFKVEKISEKVDLKVNHDNNVCKNTFDNERRGTKNDSKLQCFDDCCRDCNQASTGRSSYGTVYY